jgi:uncharacterized membrane protein YhiD involved in acid resistance
MNRVTFGVLITFILILIGSGVFAYLLRDQTESSPTSVTAPGSPGATSQPAGPPKHESPFLWEIFGPDASGLLPANYVKWETAAARITLRFALAAFLAVLLAFRPRRSVSGTRRNPFVAQTQILMAVVAAAMMMVVGDSAARAFGIFAAASLVRFRTNIRDPKEITVLLICLGVGLAAGVGRWDMALILTLFVLLALSILEYFEQSQVFRSMEVKIDTRNVEKTNAVLTELFAKHGFDAELRELNRPDEDDPMGKIVYLVNLGHSVSTSKLSDEILSADNENVDSVEWDQKEVSTYIYK